MASAFVLGGRSIRWSLASRSIGRIIIDADMQLVIIGIVNKTLDLIVQHVLEHMGLLQNTLWMLDTGPGATMQDTQIKDEMGKPWAAVRAYWRRRHTVGFWDWASVVRLFLCLGLSLSVLFLGASLNTVAWPKQRWFPNRYTRTVNLTEHATEAFTIYTPLQTLERIAWDQDVRDGRSLVGDAFAEMTSKHAIGGAADEIARAIAASRALLVLTRLPGMYNESLQDWQGTSPLVGPNAQSTSLTGIQTQINGSTVQTLSVQSEHVASLFTFHQQHGKAFARTATGFHAILQMTGPSLRTVCSNLTEDSVPDDEIDIRMPDNGASFTVQIGPNAELSFRGVYCTLVFMQALVPVESWITDLQPIPWIGISNITAPASLQPLPMNTASADALIAKSLATHFNATMPSLQGLVPDTGLVPLLTMAARTLQAQRPDFDSDAASMAAVIAILAQQQLSASSWTFRVHEDHLIASWPVQWQLYGSGPRLPWEWIAIVAFCIVLLAMANYMGLVLVYRIRPGAWLGLSGMMCVAHKTSETLPEVDRVRSADSFQTRQKIARKMDDEVRYKVKADVDQWPILLECTRMGKPR
ncbi:hypothetical protein K491DRAFT_712295 [Lophiostoma macrostomum CBS 122681]|uniref:Uncharacterized protein n=1 Tax=Lophiostoma macrostomum CBS 122681 TaxID=1314788 RepID=A0A6A6TIA4_9PLEO|nr:hypothetical protein K491DRAFT_712295 [Lophiostoma macrostomum CBS 122681]